MVWNIFFDLHGPLVDLRKVFQNYDAYLVTVLSPIGLSHRRISCLHRKALDQWLDKVNKIATDPKCEIDPDYFLKEMERIDKEWEQFILTKIPKSKRMQVEDHIKASIVEYNALAKGQIPILFPEVRSTLLELSQIPTLNLNIASSASSHHIKGVIILHNLEGLFKYLIGYDIVKAPKKGLTGIYYKKIIELTQAQPAKTIFIGDSREEAAHSKKVGFKFIMVSRNGTTFSDLETNDTFHYVRKFDETPSLVHEWLEMELKE